jgi:hypothetical protein
LIRSFIFKRTNQLSVREKGQFLSLFAKVFPKSLDGEGFERKYLRTPLGYSHHGVMSADGMVVGAYNLIPYTYTFFGTRVLFGLSVDTMIASEHRGGPFNMLRMASLASGAAERDGISFVFGFPNDSAYEFTQRVLKWRDIGTLDFHALPVNIGAVKPALRWANPLSRLVAGGFVRLPQGRGGDSFTFGVEKLDGEQFESHRYNHGHHTVKLAEGKCAYCTCLEEGRVRTTYLVDVAPLTARCFAQAVRAVYGRVAGQVDLLLYVGRLPFRARGLVRVPASRRPRQIHMCGRILDPAVVDDRIFDMENWNVNISNFDVR